MAEEAPEIAALRQKHSDALSSVKAIFPEWDDESLLMALSEASGQPEVVIGRIADGACKSAQG
jgi:hypothetical protein